MGMYETKKTIRLTRRDREALMFALEHLIDEVYFDDGLDARQKRDRADELWALHYRLKDEDEP